MKRLSSTTKVKLLAREALAVEKLKRRLHRALTDGSGDGKIGGLLGYYSKRTGILFDRNGKASRRLVTPKVFSFTDNPDATLRFLQDLVKASLCVGVRRIHVDQHDASIIGYGATTALVTIMTAIRDAGLEVSGRLPRDGALRGIVAATGLPREFGVGLDHESIEYFGVRRGRVRDFDIRNDLDETNTALLAYIDSCLSKHGYKLGGVGRYEFQSACTEVLCNAERHSGRKEWWVSGYAIRGIAGASLCHLAFLDFGYSIAETMATMSPDVPDYANISSRIERLCATGAGLSRRPTEESLWTLYALQDKISSKKSVASDRAGCDGNGMGKLIRFFQKLSPRDNRSRFTIISGRTQMLFDHTYELRDEETRSGASVGVLAFNHSNDLDLAPDARFVRTLKRHFPGTIITMRFVIDRSHLMTLEDKDG